MVQEGLLFPNESRLPLRSFTFPSPSTEAEPAAAVEACMPKKKMMMMIAGFGPINIVVVVKKKEEGP